MAANRVPASYIFSQRLKKAWLRVSTDFGQLGRAVYLRSGPIEPFESIPIPNNAGDPENGHSIISGRFSYTDKNLDVGRQGNPWPLPAPSERFAFWLHSFDWLDDLLTSPDKHAHSRARDLIDLWIDSYGKWNSYSWDNDILANRLFNWLSRWSQALATDRMSKSGKARRVAVLRQAKRLRRKYKYTSAGLPKLKAASVIVLTGLFLRKRNETYLSQGLDWLDREIDEQILPDGGHISRSPEQTLEALHILSVVSTALRKCGVDTNNTLERSIERLRHILLFFVMPDGRLPSFNGGGLGNAILINNLITKSKASGKPFAYCPHSGYQRLVGGKTIILMDTGAPPPVPYDELAHLGPLGFELSYDKNRLIVSCGWSNEQPLVWKDPVRQTAAHSALILNEKSCGKILNNKKWSSRGLPTHIMTGPSQVNAGRKEQQEGNWLETSHNGYMATYGLACRRRLYMNSSGNDIRGEDSLLVPLGKSPHIGKALPFKIRFHLHPLVKATLSQDLNSALLIQPGQVAWRFRTDGGPISIEPSVYLADGKRPVRTKQLVILGAADTDSDGETSTNRVRWSLKRLQKRS